MESTRDSFENVQELTERHTRLEALVHIRQNNLQRLLARKERLAAQSSEFVFGSFNDTPDTSRSQGLPNVATGRKRKPSPFSPRIFPNISDTAGQHFPISTDPLLCQISSFNCPIFSQCFVKAGDEINHLLSKYVPYSIRAISLWNEVVSARNDFEAFKKQVEQRLDKLKPAGFDFGPWFKLQLLKHWRRVMRASKNLGSLPLTSETDESRRHAKARDDAYSELNKFADLTESTMEFINKAVVNLKKTINQIHTKHLDLNVQKSEFAIGRRMQASPDLPSSLLNRMVQNFELAYKQVFTVSLDGSPKQAVDEACEKALEHANALLLTRDQILVSRDFIENSGAKLEQLMDDLDKYLISTRASLMTEVEIQEAKMFQTMKQRVEVLIREAIAVYEALDNCELDYLNTEAQRRQFQKEHNLEGARNAKGKAEQAKRKAQEYEDKLAHLDQALRALLTKNSPTQDSEQDLRVECHFPELYGYVTRLLYPDLSCSVSSTAISLKADLLVKGLLLLDNLRTDPNHLPSEMMSMLSKTGNLRIVGAITSEGRPVVLKKMPSQNLKGIYRSLFLSKKAQHPNILPCEGARVGESQEVVELQFPFMHGGNLLQWAKSRHRSIMTRLNVICGAADGLAYLHSLNICHRDLKPQNILLESMDDEACAKIADFDQSKEIVSGVFGASTTVFSVGTLGYMAPEVSQRRDQVDLTRSDVYALAGTVVVILAYEGDELAVPRTPGPVPVFDFIAAYEESIGTLQRVLDEDSLLVLRRALSMNSAERPSAQELACALAHRNCYIQCCDERHTLSTGFVCNAFEPHFICAEDFDRHLATLEPGNNALIKRDQQFYLRCPYGQGCDGQISIETFSNRLPPASLTGVLRLIQTQTEIELRRELASEHKAELDRIKQQTVNSIRVSTCDEHITDRIMVPKCPGCHVAYEHYDGCMAMTCDRCQTHFCAACEERCDDSARAHAHVRRCPFNINQGSVFAAQNILEQIRCTRRQSKLREYLRNQHLTKDQLEALEQKPNTKAAMRNLGLTKLDLLLN